MLRKILKWLSVIVVAGLVAGAIFVVNLVWFRPFSLNLFYEKSFVTFALEKPELLTSLGIAEQFGYRRHNAHLDDLSIAKADHDFATWRENLADLRSYDLAAQTPSQRLSTRVMAFFIESLLEGERFRFHNYPVNQLFGVQNDTPEFLMTQHRIADRRGAEDYLSRLREVGRKFDQVLEGLAMREKIGVVPPRFVIERVVTEMRSFAGKPVLQNPLYTNFAAKVAKLTDVTAPDKEALDARCARLIESDVIPAYQRLIRFHEAQLSRSTTDDGVWKLPDGDAYYAYRLRTATTTRMTPQQVHDLGLAEVARIEGEMKSRLTTQNELRPGEAPAQALARLAKDPRFLYPNTDEGRKAALADYGRMLDDQLARSRAVIGLIPKAPIEVQRIPEFREKTAPGAYYDSPAMDGTRPGIFYANLRDMSELPKFVMRTFALHEGVPGHHFQAALAQQQKGVPTFRQVLNFIAYDEGWALYAEWLGTELGVYKDDPFGDLGRLQFEMVRAVRLVVDTGIHYKRWPRERAIAYMIEKTGMTEAAVVSEIERYIVLPGQACSYKVGMLTIQAARQRAQAALGSRFDVEAEKAFHDVVLGGGSLPLEVLDEQVAAWIKARAQ